MQSELSTLLRYRFGDCHQYKKKNQMWSDKLYLILVATALFPNVLPADQILTTTSTFQQPRDISSAAETRTDDPDLCMEKASKGGLALKRFGVLPGVGWDNLRNSEAAEVVKYSFINCKTTDDGFFLLPDNVFTVPIKESNVQLYAELIKNWEMSSSSTANTINADVSAGFSSFSISGKYSREHSELKMNQYRDSAVTVRIQLRYNRYEAKLQPDSVLTRQFKNRLLSIADKIEQDQTKLARYESQMLVRDFGTHVLTSVTAGAALIKDDYIKKTFAEDSKMSTTKILATASASFTGWFNFSASLSYSSEVSNSVASGYSNSVTQSFIKSHGGPVFTPGHTTLEKWTNDIDMNFVPLDRDGQPLTWLINSATLPDLSPDVVIKVAKMVEQAINTYYEMNTIRGCTKLDSPNFSLAANVDDRTCHPAPTMAAFGGIYRTCSITGSYISNNPCGRKQQNNPKTGSTTCPTNFVAVKILSETSSSVPESEKYNCNGCGFLWLNTCCKERFHAAVAHISTFWCAPLTKTSAESGYLFGGLYTSATINPFTGSMTCPPHFFELRMSSEFTELKVCVCDDTELCAEASVPFGGFFRCDVGNPMAANGTSSEGSNSPKGCPSGHSQHLIMNDDGCSLHFCVRTGTLSNLNLPQVKRPPFMRQPHFIPKYEILDMFEIETQASLDNDTEEQLTMTVLGKPTEAETIASKAVMAQKALAEDNKWSTKKKKIVALTLLKEQQPQTHIITKNSQKPKSLPDQGDKLSSFAVAGIAMAATLAFMALISLVVFTARKRIKNHHSYSRLSEETTVLQSSYGTAGSV